jgi:hypothetical protein
MIMMIKLELTPEDSQRFPATENSYKNLYKKKVKIK